LSSYETVSSATPIPLYSKGVALLTQDVMVWCVMTIWYQSIYGRGCGGVALKI
jgi:hypothetical protein